MPASACRTSPRRRPAAARRTCGRAGASLADRVVVAGGGGGRSNGGSAGGDRRWARRRRWGRAREAVVAAPRSRGGQPRRQTAARARPGCGGAGGNGDNIAGGVAGVAGGSGRAGGAGVPTDDARRSRWWRGRIRVTGPADADLSAGVQTGNGCGDASPIDPSDWSVPGDLDHDGHDDDDRGGAAGGGRAGIHGLTDSTYDRSATSGQVRPNQRRMRLEPNSTLSAASAVRRVLRGRRRAPGRSGT